MVSIDDMFYDSEAEPSSAGRTRPTFIRSVESLGQQVDFPRINPDSIVLYGENKIPCIVIPSQFYCAALWGVADRIMH